MDEVLKVMVDEKKSKEELLKLGFEEDLINRLEYRIKANAFKGKLPTIAKIGLLATWLVQDVIKIFFGVTVKIVKVLHVVLL